MRRTEEKLTPDQIEKIRRYKSEGWTLAQIAERFGIARSTASDIVNGRRWTDESDAEIVRAVRSEQLAEYNRAKGRA